jgi:hypothetical protein
MYDWVTHTHSHLGGECPHKCSYCYVQRNRFGVSPRYTGQVRFIEQELNVNYGTGKTIFIEHMNDLFADGVPEEFIMRVLTHCDMSFGNKYVFQTKNPARAHNWLTLHKPVDYMLGTTIESNREYPSISKAPAPYLRRDGMMKFIGTAQTFVTIEPIMDFDILPLVEMIVAIKPAFINIGADSKHCGLPEPTPTKVKEFVCKLHAAGIVIRKKVNLARMLVA